MGLAINKYSIILHYSNNRSVFQQYVLVDLD